MKLNKRDSLQLEIKNLQAELKEIFKENSCEDTIIEEQLSLDQLDEIEETKTQKEHSMKLIYIFE